MQIQVTKLRGILELMKPVVPRNKKTKIPVVTYILFERGKAVATDLESMVTADLPEAEESMLLPYTPLAELLKYVPGTELLQIEATNSKVSLSWSEGKASYGTLDPAEFPVLSDLAATAEADLDGDTLIASLTAALPYVATEENRPVLNGVTLVLGRPVEVASGDGFRMSHQILGDFSFPVESKVIIPAHSVAILDHVFAKTPRTPPFSDSLIPVLTAKRQLHISLIGDSKLRVDFGQSASVIINLIQGDPPAWLALIPKEQPVLESQLFAPQFEAAVRRVRNIAMAGTNIVRLVFADGKLNVSATHDNEEVSASIPTLNTQGAPNRVALNANYLLGYLSGKEGIVLFSKFTDTGPVVFQYQKSPRVLIMPMFVEWGDEPPPVVENKTEPETVEETHDNDAQDEPEDETESPEETPGEEPVGS